MFKTIQRMKNEKGFTLLELLIVIAIIGVLIAIAVPLYLGHTKRAKCTAAYANWETAHKLVRAELAKAALETPTSDVVKDLNAGGKKNPWDATKDAFKKGTAGDTDKGTVHISETDLSKVPVGGTVTVAVKDPTNACGWVSTAGVANELTITITRE